MRRPFCVAALFFAALLLIWLQLCPPQYPDYRALDRRTLTAVGTVTAKDHRQSEGGALTLLITLKNVQILDSSSENAAKDTASGRNAKIVPVARRVLVRVPEDLVAAEQASPIGARIAVQGKIRCFQEATNPGEFDARLYYRTRGYDLQMSNAEILTDHSSCNTIDNTDSRIAAKGMNHPTAMNKGGGMNSCPIKKDPLRDFLYRIRCRGSDVLRRCLSAEDASVLQAMLLGEKGYLSDETKRLYQQNGIIHILAISGLHISVIGMGIYRLLRSLLGWLFTYAAIQHKSQSAAALPQHRHDPRAEYLRTERFLCLQQWISGTAAILLMILYGLMTSAGASAVRAIIMFILHIRAIRIRRTYDLLTAVSAAAVLILIQEPLYLYDSGFLFSFSAVIAIGALLPSLKGKVLKTLAVPLGTLPVSIHFNSFFPIWSVLINLLVLPMMGLLLPIGFLVLLLGLLSVKLGILAGTAAHVILLCYYALCRMAQRLPGSVLVTGSCSTLQIFLYLLCLAGAAYIGSSPASLRRVFSFSVLRTVKLCSRAHKQFHKLFSRFYPTTCKVQRKRSFIPLWQSLLIALGIAILLYRPAHGLSVHVIDVGQGDGIHIQYEETAIMIDGGSTDKQNLAQYQLEPFLRYQGCSVIDCWIITHGDSDHCSGLLQILENPESFRTVQIRQILLPAAAKSEVNALLSSSSKNEGNALPLAAVTSKNRIPVSESSKVSNYQKIASLAQACSIPVGFIKKGDIITHGNLSLTCLHPSDNSTYSEPNEESVVLYLQYGAFDALFTGDLEGAGEADLLKELTERSPAPYPTKGYFSQSTQQSENTDNINKLSAAPQLTPDYPLQTSDSMTAMQYKTQTCPPISLDLLKVAHHGSSGATSEAFLSYFQPKKAVISCGRNNRYGHPHRETMERLSEAGADVLQTKVCGEITYQTDGKYLTVRPFLSN